MTITNIHIDYWRKSEASGTLSGLTQLKIGEIFFLYNYVLKFFLAGYSSCYTNFIFYTKQFIFNANMFQQTASAIIRADL